jgi:phosphopantothenoylcysteine decarboxylase/phosphopantothenate--cysteine ligase
VVSAGGTHEPLDPVRYLGNRSSGRQGYALARVAAQRGAQVTLVAAHTADLTDPAGVEVIRVATARDMREAVLTAAPYADAVVMAAAVADFRPADPASDKIKKSSSDPAPLSLVLNPDILLELVRCRPTGQVVVGFAAELTHGRAKLARKGCDLLAVNAVGRGGAFEVDHNAGWLLSGDGVEAELPEGPKSLLASYVWDAVVARLEPSS